MNDQHDFGDRLLSAQSITPELRERYQRRLESMYDRELTLMQRVYIGCLVIIGAFAVAMCAYAIMSGIAMNIPTKIATALVGLVALVVTVLRGRSALIGNWNMRWQPKVMAYTIFYAVLLGFMFIIWSGGQSTIASVYILLVWTVVMILAVTKLIFMQMQQSELNTQEKLLEIELRLAEMTEQMGKKQ